MTTIKLSPLFSELIHTCITWPRAKLYITCRKKGYLNADLHLYVTTRQWRRIDSTKVEPHSFSTFSVSRISAYIEYETVYILETALYSGSYCTRPVNTLITAGSYCTRPVNNAATSQRVATVPGRLICYITVGSYCTRPVNNAAISQRVATVPGRLIMLLHHSG